MSDRKLATVRRIDNLEPIEGADKIWKATIDGWELVTAKDNGFKEGDLVIYLEIDSWVPHELAPFLSKGSEPREYNGVKGERLRTVKLRGQVSQGLILPIDSTKGIEYEPAQFAGGGFNIIYVNGEKVYLDEGYDLTEFLGIQKWEKPVSAQLSGKVKRYFPSFIRKTDQERCQNLKREIFETHKDESYEATIKLDGSSMTVYSKFGLDENDNQVVEVGVCSRNLELKLDQEGNSFVDTAMNKGIIDALQQYTLLGYGEYAVQGELMGPGIQDNREGLSEHVFFVYDIFNIKKQEYLKPLERRQVYDDLVKYGANMAHVPVITETFNLSSWRINDIKDLLSFAEGTSINHDVREGVVFKSNDSDFSFKAISNKFLLKGGD